MDLKQDKKPIASLFSDRSSRINASAIRRAFDLAQSRKNPVNLSIGQPDFPVPLEIKEALKEAIDRNQTAYTPTQGILSLREKLAEKLITENHLIGWHNEPVTAENIIVAPGVSAILYLLYATLLNTDDEIILVDPYFLIYDGLAGYFQNRVHIVREENLIEDLQKVTRDRIKFIIFSSPSNPTGRVLQKEELQAMAEILDKHGIWAIADEIYEKFNYDSSFTSLGSFYPRTITLNGFSKSYALTGLRLGYAAVPGALLQKMATIQQYTFVCAPQPTQRAGEIALTLDLSSYISDYRKRRDYIYNAIKDSFVLQKPAGAFYLFPRLKSPDITSAQFVDMAVEQDLILVPGHIFSRREGGFRISFATSMEQLEKGAKILNSLAQKISAR